LHESTGRRSPRHGQSAEIAADDDAAWRLVAEKWADERLHIVRQDGERLVSVPKS
jgi:hypothetical protein